MSNKFYEERWIKHLDTSYDDMFKPLQKTEMAWLPWIGKDYKKATGKILIVGESHYTNEPNHNQVDARKLEISNNPNFTREVTAEYPLEGYEAGWKNACGRKNNPTFDNLHRALLERDLLNSEEKEMRGVLWQQIGFYNIVQRPMDYGAGRRERPNPSDFLNGWLTFLKVVRILQPKTCIFLGVTASNFFSEAMTNNEAVTDLSMEFTPVDRGEKFNGINKRTGGSMTIMGIKTDLIFMRHTSQYFRWKLWNTYLKENIPESMAYLKKTVLNEE